jgi:hypothetical protein
MDESVGEASARFSSELSETLYDWGFKLDGESPEHLAFRPRAIAKRKPCWLYATSAITNSNHVRDRYCDQGPVIPGWSEVGVGGQALYCPQHTANLTRGASFGPSWCL